MPVSTPQNQLANDLSTMQSLHKPPQNPLPNQLLHIANCPPSDIANQMPRTPYQTTRHCPISPLAAQNGTQNAKFGLMTHHQGYPIPDLLFAILRAADGQTNTQLPYRATSGITKKVQWWQNEQAYKRARPILPLS